MKHTRLFILFIRTFLLLPAIGNAQSYITKVYTTFDGLSDNYILYSYQDSYGYLWVGTANGLNRFDGKEFVHFNTRDGLPSPLVDRIFEDSKHRLWIGTRKGMAELKGDSCYTYPVNDKQEISFVSGFLEPEKGKIWVTTDKGLYEFSNDHWNKITLYPGNENVAISKILITPNGLYVNYLNRKLIWKKTNGQFEILLSVNSNNPYFNNFFIQNDTVFISTYTDLRYWNGKQFLPYFSYSLGKNFIYTIFPDSKGNYWIPTGEEGLLVLNKSAHQTKVRLPHNLVSNIMEDRDHHFWIASFKGLVKVLISPYENLHIDGLDEHVTIRNFIALPGGNFLVSADNGKLVLFKPDIQKETQKAIASMQLNKVNDFIDFFCFNEKLELLFTTRKGSLYKLSGNELTDLTSSVSFPTEFMRGLAFNKKTKTLFVCGDSVLIAGNEEHLDTFFTTGKHFVPLPWKVFLNEDENSLMVQTLDNGLLYINSAGKMQKVEKNLIDLTRPVLGPFEKGNMEESFWGNNINNCLVNYSWKKTMDLKLKDIISEKDGLPDNNILDIARDAESNIWLATARGLTVFKKTGTRWIHRDIEIIESGLPLALSFSKLAINDDKNVFMSVGNKLCAFIPLNFSHNADSLITVIEKVQLQNGKTNWAELSDSLYSYRQIPFDLKLRHDQNVITISFKAVQLGENPDLEYSYRLIPAETNWSEGSSGNKVTFYKLSPGEYQFEVRSHIKGFDWSQAAIYSFTIKEAFWNSWWFRIAMAILVAGIIILIFLTRIKQIKDRIRVKNQLLELEMKALKAQMNPHFIYNSLNSIQALIANDRSKEASKYISQFANLLRQVLDQSDMHVITLEKELKTLQLYISLEGLRLDFFPIVEIQFSEELDKSSELIPPLILQPFVENSLWHGLSDITGEKILKINIITYQDLLTISIIDNGIGRIKASSQKINMPGDHQSKGISITNQRLKDYNNDGLEPIAIVDLSDDSGHPCGTKVTLKIRRHA